ncbi:hypothetical protein EW145_g8178, partial [Phellinidium pouzarii]
ADAMPFAVIMPEQSSRMRRALKAPPLLRPVSTYSTDTSGYPQTPVTQNGDVEEGADVKSDRGTPTPTAVMKSDHLPYMDGAPRDLKGVFVRRFRWGVVDVLDPMHCDFAALRTAVLSTHFKVLKMNTKEVLYEKYRTEKLLARRATRNISDEDRKRLLEDRKPLSSTSSFTSSLSPPSPFPILISTTLPRLFLSSAINIECPAFRSIVSSTTVYTWLTSIIEYLSVLPLLLTMRASSPPPDTVHSTHRVAMQNFMAGDPLSLERIRSTLVRLEDTIIFSLIERAQFAHNARIYARGGIGELTALGVEGSWLEWFLKETESFHDEYPFTPASELPAPLLPTLKYPSLLHANTVNVNPTILSLYIALVPRITQAASRRASDSVANDDDGQYGSAATLDVEVLQALSKRVHFGKFVSESKFRADPAAFVAHIVARDRAALGDLITKPEVERRLLKRVRNKARLYGQEVGEDGVPTPVPTPVAEAEAAGKIEVESVVELYEHYIIPLTKEVEACSFL